MLPVAVRGLLDELAVHRSSDVAPIGDAFRDYRGAEVGQRSMLATFALTAEMIDLAA